MWTALQDFQEILWAQQSASSGSSAESQGEEATAGQRSLNAHCVKTRMERWESGACDGLFVLSFLELCLAIWEKIQDYSKVA